MIIYVTIFQKITVVVLVVIAIEIAMEHIPGSPTKSKWDSPLTLVPEASTCCTPPISVNATDWRNKRHRIFA